MSQANYWKKVYKNKNIPTEQSLFATFCREYLKDVASVLEVGSGNGRDAFFWGQTCKVHAYDIACQPKDTENVTFHLGSMEKVQGQHDLLYSRFSLHSVQEEIEDFILKYGKEHCKYIAIECRTVKDSIATELNERNEGSHSTTYADAHYRRYLDYETFKTKLETMGFHILHAGESDKYAPYKGYSPWCLRLIASSTNE
jgi:hypothetical protein